MPINAQQSISEWTGCPAEVTLERVADWRSSHLLVNNVQFVAHLPQSNAWHQLE